MNISEENNDGIAMDGFDPVAHFENVPLRGISEFSFAIDDMTYYFATAQNLNLTTSCLDLRKFEAEPEKYIPIAGAYPTGIRVAPPKVDPTEEGYVGNKIFEQRKDLEDSPVSLENNVPIDIKEDGSVEMQNLSDDEN